MYSNGNEQETLKRARQYLQCYPALHAAQFIRLLLDCQESLSKKNSKLKEEADTKFNLLKNDPKGTSLGLLENAQILCKEAEERLVLSNIELCRLRVLNDLYATMERKASK